MVRLLEQLGAYAGEESDFYPPTAHDADGHRERIDVWTVNEDALARLGAAWDRPLGASAQALTEADRGELQARIAAVVGHLDQRPGSWVIKDPRLCLLMGLWGPALPAGVAVVALRNPVEIARSLAARDGLPVPVGVALWEAYMRAAFAGLGGRPCVRLRYDELLHDPVATVERLRGDLRPWGELAPTAAAQLGALASPRRQRHAASAADLDAFLSPAQVALWEAMLAPVWEPRALAGELTPGARVLLEGHASTSLLVAELRRRDVEISHWNERLTAEVAGVRANLLVAQADREREAGLAAAARLGREVAEARATAEAAAREQLAVRGGEWASLAEQLAGLASAGHNAARRRAERWPRLLRSRSAAAELAAEQRQLAHLRGQLEQLLRLGWPAP